MSESIEPILKPFNPLGGASFNSGAGPDLVMHPADDCARFSLRIPTGQLKKATDAFGGNIPAAIGAMSHEDEKVALCLGPDEWLLLVPHKTVEKFAARFDNLGETTPCSLVDVSHRTIGIEISGPLATLLLNSGCPLDLGNMAVERCTRTVLDKAEIILMKLEEQRYRLEIVRSFAPFVWSFLENAGRDFHQTGHGGD